MFELDQPKTALSGATLLSRVRAAVIVGSLACSVVTSPTVAQQDSLMERLQAAYNEDDCSTVIQTASSSTVSSLSSRHRAQAEILHGACLFDRGDSTEAFAAYGRAVIADVDERPNPTLFAPDRVAMYDRARAALPIVADIELRTNQFRPLLNERIVFHYVMERSGQSVPNSSRVSFSLRQSSSGATQSMQVDPQTRTVIWNGRFGPNDQIAEPGPYEIVVAASHAISGRTTTLRKTLVIDAAPSLARPWFQPLPRVPLFESESVAVRLPDIAKKRSMRNKGLIAALVGVGAASIAYTLSNTAADDTSPNSFGRFATAGVYTGGVAVGVFGAVKFFQGILSDYLVTTNVPAEHAISNNRRAITAFRDNFQDAVEKNHLAVMSYAIKLTIQPVDGIPTASATFR